MKKKLYDIKLNIKSIVLYEKLTKQPFSDFSSNQQQISALIYSMLCANNRDFTVTYNDCIEVLFSDEKFMLDLCYRLETIMKFEEQFFQAELKNIQEKETTITKEGAEKKEGTFIYKLIPILVYDCNLDVNYVLNEMHYSEIPDYIKHKEDVEKVGLIEKRLFTYLTMLPHINSKKVKSPSDILPFDFEIEAKSKKAAAEVNKNQDKLMKFLEQEEITSNNNKI